MKDCEAGDLNDYATLSPKGKYVLLRSNSQENTQNVVVVDYGLEPTKTISKPSSPSAEKGSAGPFNLEKVPENVSAQHESDYNIVLENLVTNCHWVLVVELFLNKIDMKCPH